MTTYEKIKKLRENEGFPISSIQDENDKENNNQQIEATKKCDKDAASSDIGKRIKQRRKSMHLSADELGEIVGKDRSTIYRYENGDIGMMPLEVLLTISDVLHTSPSYLLGRETNEGSSKQTETVEFISPHEILHSTRMKIRIGDYEIEGTDIQVTLIKNKHIEV